jgi:hypothetical protein
MDIEKSEDDIFAMLDKAMESQEKYRNRYSGMTYQEGIIATLDWILGRSEYPPLED